MELDRSQVIAAIALWVNNVIALDIVHDDKLQVEQMAIAERREAKRNLDRAAVHLGHLIEIFALMPLTSSCAKRKEMAERGCRQRRPWRDTLTSRQSAPPGATNTRRRLTRFTRLSRAERAA
jgi:hypothetical protein